MSGVVGPMHVVRSSQMSSWSLCVSVAHIWRQLQMLSSGSSAKHSWNPWRSLRRRGCQREEKGEPRAPEAKCGFPITRKLFGPDSGITRCSLEPRGRDGPGEPETKGEGVDVASQCREQCRVEAAGPVLPWARGIQPREAPLGNGCALQAPLGKRW